VHIGILVGRTRAVSSLGLVTFADGCPMRPIPPGHCPHRGPISSNRTPDSMGFDAHRTPPPMGILPEADDLALAESHRASGLDGSVRGVLPDLYEFAGRP